MKAGAGPSPREVEMGALGSALEKGDPAASPHPVPPLKVHEVAFETPPLPPSRSRGHSLFQRKALKSSHLILVIRGTKWCLVYFYVLILPQVLSDGHCLYRAVDHQLSLRESGKVSL